jgi:leucyl aminopeptidase (aminopeptidase T)
MPGLLGTEPRREYFALEAAAAARKLLAEVMLVLPGENVVITADTQSDFRLVEATAAAAYALGAHPAVVWYETRPRAQMEPLPPVAAAVQTADVWVEYAVQYTLYTDTRREACSRGVRYAAFGGLDVDSIVRTIGRVDYPTMMALGEKLVALTRGSADFRVTTALGTDLRCDNRGADVYQSGRLGDEPGAAVMLGGQVVWLPEEESVEGTIVVDGVLWPPDAIGVVRDPVRLRVECGRITEIEGGAEARLLADWLDGLGDPTMRRIAHLTYGFNPGVTRFSGRIAEDERVFGAFDFGFGGWMDRPAPSHFDGVITAPTIAVDGVEIERGGRFVHPELADLCRRLGAPGY